MNDICVRSFSSSKGRENSSSHPVRNDIKLGYAQTGLATGLRSKRAMTNAIELNQFLRFLFQRSMQRAPS